MVNSLNSLGAVTLFVTDSRRSKDWYRAVFDLPVIYEDDVSAVLQMENLIVNLLMRDEADELIHPATVAATNSGASFQLTIWVEDADAACDDLRSRGVHFLNGPVDREWGQRTACFPDPDGHVWEVAQHLS